MVNVVNIDEFLLSKLSFQILATLNEKIRRRSGFEILRDPPQKHHIEKEVITRTFTDKELEKLDSGKISNIRKRWHSERKSGESFISFMDRVSIEG